MSENDWDVSKPVDHTLISAVPEKIRDVKSSAKIIITKEHIAPATDNAGGQHAHGSARVYAQADTPTLDPEGNSLETTVGPSTNVDHGRLAVLTAASNTLKVYIATSAGISTGFEAVMCERVKLEETMDANSKGVENLATGSQTGQPIHVGQIDTTFFNFNEPATTADLRVKVSTGLTTSHGGGLQVDATPGTWTPSAYNGEESITLPNGLILKGGTFTVQSNPDTISFDTAFPNTLIGLGITFLDNTNPNGYVTAANTSGFTFVGGASQPIKVLWMAMGR